MPIEVHDRFLQTQQVVDSAVDDIHSSCVSSLCSKVVLPVYREM